ncbi:MAG: hypothetical protein R3C05_10900 [Pirellulaceae bacterium]
MRSTPARPSQLADKLFNVYRTVLSSNRDLACHPPTRPGKLFRQLASYEAFKPCRTIEL